MHEKIWHGEKTAYEEEDKRPRVHLDFQTYIFEQFKNKISN